MSPEEFAAGAVIDERTNVYTMGALAFALFSGFSRKEEDWMLPAALYRVAAKAVSEEKNERYASLQELLAAWEAALKE